MKNPFIFINKFIQWTKKFHFFHVFFVAPFLLTLVTIDAFCLYFTCVNFIISIISNDFSIFNIKEGFESFCNFLKFHSYYYILFFFYTTIFSFFTEIFFLMSNKIRKNSLFITNIFLLKNKLYNTIYILAILLFIHTITFLCLYNNLTIY